MIPSPEGAAQVGMYRLFGAEYPGESTFQWLRHRQRLCRAFGPKSNNATSKPGFVLVSERCAFSFSRVFYCSTESPPPVQ
jgi:hypothetical protein